MGDYFKYSKLPVKAYKSVNEGLNEKTKIGNELKRKIEKEIKKMEMEKEKFKD